MSIAQRFVACEGEVCLKPEDESALAAFSCDSTNLPWVIFRAAFRAAHVDRLSARARTVLSALARTVDARRPYAAVYARRDLLTGRAMQSMRTFYRSLDDLEAAGLILRQPQTRYVVDGQFGRAYLRLTVAAGRLLGLDASPEASAKVAGPNQPATGEAPTLPSATVADGAIYKDLYPASSQKRQPGQPPVDLQRLRPLGFHDFLIFKLMREARERGKRLSDVVEATWQHLKRANRPICYLRALIASTVDFSFQVRRKREASDASRNEQAAAFAAQDEARKAAGKVFISEDGNRRFSVSDDGLTAWVQYIDESAARVVPGVWQVAFATAVQQGRIQLATPQQIKAFENAVARTGHVRRVYEAPRATPARPQRVCTEVETLKPGLTQDGREQLAAIKGILGLRARLTPTVVAGVADSAVAGGV